MKSSIIVFVVAVVLAAGLVPLMPATANSGESLTPYMSQFQRYSHKLGLSIDAKNKELSGFYLLKIKETMGEVETRFPTWEKLQVGALVKAMLGATSGQVEGAVAKGDWAAASTAYDAMLANGCNGCHVATQRTYIKIIRTKSNPFSQTF